MIIRQCTDCGARIRRNNKSGFCTLCWKKPNGHQAEYARGWRKRNRDYLREAKGNYAYEKYYGISYAAIQKLRTSQKNRCTLCNQEYPRLVLDHDHTEGRVRGLLCPHCNTCLGWVEAHTLASITSYLENATLGLTVDMNRWRKSTRARYKTTLACSVADAFKPSATKKGKTS